MVDMSYVPAAATFSKGASFFGKRFPFQYVTAADGAYLQGNDGKWYMDWVSGLGANLFGYANYELTEHVNKQLCLGNGLSLPSVLEYAVAEQLCHILALHVPGWQGEHLQTRWVTSGSEACEAAIRLARAVTGKNSVLSAGYHGQSGNFVSISPPAHGIPLVTKSHIWPIEYGKSIDLDYYDGPHDKYGIAAVILEHGATDPPAGYYERVRKFCDDNRCLFIMDEVVTGLRYGLGGACEAYGIQPDLICMGKALSAGHALAALVGPKAYLNWFARVDPVFISSTNAGNTGGLAAAEWILEHWSPRTVDYIWSLGKRLLEGLNEGGIHTIGHPPRSLVLFDDEYAKAYFILGMAKRGYIMNRPNFPTMAHIMSLVEKTISAAREVQGEIAKLGAEGLRAAIAEDELPFVLFRNR